MDTVDVPNHNEDDHFAFLGNGGVIGSLIRAYDWKSTPVGCVTTWPSSLKNSVALLLQSSIPMVMLWGEDGVMVYNEGYSVIAGARHPGILGAKVRESWAEVADFNDNVLKVGLAGGTLAYRDQELTLHRKGVPEQVWLDLFYSPVLDESGKPAGVIAIVVETTERVLADRRNALEHQRLQQLFEQAPAFMAMLSGPDHIFEMLNPECGKLIGDRDVIGRPIEAALPEIADQGFVALLDKAFETGQPVTRIADRVFLQRSEDQQTEHFLDFVFQPIRNDRGQVTHIFVQGSDVTARVRGENHQKLLVAELNHRVKNTLASVQSIVSQTLRTGPSPEEARATISGRIMALSRAHDVLTHQRWDGADLGSIIEALVRPFDDQGKRRLKITGPRIRLSTRAALSISSAIHELATNAARYGALSNDAGTVAISWTVKRPKDAGHFALTWIEKGGPAVVKPSRTGFGSKVILRALPIELGGSADIEYASGGLVFRLQTPLANVEESTDIG